MSEKQPKYPFAGLSQGAPIEPIEGYTQYGKDKRRAQALTLPSKGIPMIGGKKKWSLGAGFVVINEEQHEGFWSRMSVHVSHLFNKNGGNIYKRPK